MPESMPELESLVSILRSWVDYLAPEQYERRVQQLFERVLCAQETLRETPHSVEQPVAPLCQGIHGEHRPLSGN